MPASQKSPAKKKPARAKAEAINENLGRRVKKLRAERGWSLEALATASGVSRSMLSEIERENANPTLSVTYRIAQAFGLTLHDLIETAQAASSIQVIRAADRAQIFRSDQPVPDPDAVAAQPREGRGVLRGDPARGRRARAASRTTRAPASFSPSRKAMSQSSPAPTATT